MLNYININLFNTKKYNVLINILFILLNDDYVLVYEKNKKLLLFNKNKIYL